MTLTEIPSWKKWGLHGVFEWHENEVITSRLFFSHFSNAKRNTNFRGIFFFHFLNGGLAGVAFPYISIFLLHSVNALSLSLFGLVYGIVLWAITLVHSYRVSPRSHMSWSFQYLGLLLFILCFSVQVISSPPVSYFIPIVAIISLTSSSPSFFRMSFATLIT